MDEKSVNESNFPDYVGEFYDDLYKRVGSYSDWRWFKSKYALCNFNQTKDSIFNINYPVYKNVLDIGTGDGIWVELFSPFIEYADCIDVSKEMIKLAKKRLSKKKVTLIEGDFMKFPFNKKYDFISVIRCFEYLPNKEKAISKFNSLLNKNGDVLIVTKNPHYFRIKREDALLHSKQIPVEEIIKIMEKNGFEIKKVYPSVFGEAISMHFPFFRGFFNKIHKIMIKKDKNYSGFFKKHFSESFLIFARKK
jgi:SAM-dependent methyltransferase